MTSQIEYAAHCSHLDDLARSARASRRTRRPSRAGLARDHEVAIRSAGPADNPSLTLLAALDSSSVPGGDVLLGSVDGEVRAAVSVEDGEAIADPFAPTVELVELMRVRAERLRAPAAPLPRRAALLRRLARRFA